MAARYIAVEGPIGVGKTTLARILAAHYGGRLILEQVEDNPFLGDFYKDRQRFAFQAQLFFLLSRVRQQIDLATGELIASHVITDYFFGKDRVFATLNLSPPELAMYGQVASLYEKNVPMPDLIIFLTAPPHVLMERIRQRDRAFEKQLDLDYLEDLCEAYARYFFDLNSDGGWARAPILVVNTEHVNFATQPEQSKYLIERIENVQPGTTYLVLAE